MKYLQDDLSGKTLLRLLFSIISLALYVTVCGCVSDAYYRKSGNHLHLCSVENEVFWFSGIHSNDPGHPMFEDIDSEFTKFAPDLVLVEGGANQKEYENQRDAIIEGGEAGYVAYIAKKRNIDVENIEPDARELYTHLLRTFDARSIMAMLVLRQMAQKQREIANNPIEFNEYFVKFIMEKQKKGLSLESSEISPQYIGELLGPFVGFTVTSFNWRNVPAQDIIYQKKSVIHSIWRETTAFRNDHVIALIEKKLQNYNRIFVMMGFDHARKVEHELRALFARYQTE